MFKVNNKNRKNFVFIFNNAGCIFRFVIIKKIMN